MYSRLAGQKIYSNKSFNPDKSTGLISLNSQTTAFSRHKSLPVHGRAQGGEDGNMVMEENPIDWTFRPADLQGVQAAFAVYVTGNSMMPKYSENDIAYIHPTQQPRIGRFVLVETTEHEGFIKQFMGWRGDVLHLKQFNPEKTLTFERKKIRSVMRVIGSMDAG